MATKSIEWRPGPTVCRCCLAEGCYKDISTEYFWMGKREVYAEMLSETFSVSIAYSTAGGPNSNSRLICEPCISRLRDASDFKRQVQECEKTFMQHLDPGNTSCNEVEATMDAIDDVKLEVVKQERRLSDDDEFDDRHDLGANDDDDDDDDLDDQPLTRFATKVPKKESVDLLDMLDNSKATEKRKSTTKVKAAPAKKSKKDTPKATSSKPKPEKKKKGPGGVTSLHMASSIKVNWKRKRRIAEDKGNAALILQHSNAVPFRYKGGKFMCAYCPAVYANVIEIRTHSSTHDKPNVFESPEVRNSFPLRVDITDLSCNICKKTIGTLKGFKEHLFGDHGKSLNPEHGDGVIPFVLTGKEYRCVHCSVVMENTMKLFVHMNEHYQSYMCHTCGKGFSGNHKLRAHQMSHESGQFACAKCDLVFLNRTAKYRHTSKVHGPKERYRCPICDTHFDSYHSRLRHLDRTHGQKAEYRCTLCPAVFGSGTLRYSHIVGVHRKKRKSVI